MREMNLTDVEKKLIAEFVAEHNGGDAANYIDEGCDYSDYGVMDCDLTRDEFEEFDGRHWCEAAGKTEATLDGRRAVHFEKVQTHRGAPRFSLWVVDLGDFRATVKM